MYLRHPTGWRCWSPTARLMTQGRWLPASVHRQRASGLGSTEILSYSGGDREGPGVHRYPPRLRTRSATPTGRSATPTRCSLPGCSSAPSWSPPCRSEEHTSELQSHHDLVCRLLLEKKKKKKNKIHHNDPIKLPHNVYES